MLCLCNVFNVYPSEGLKNKFGFQCSPMGIRNCFLLCNSQVLFRKQSQMMIIYRFEMNVQTVLCCLVTDLSVNELKWVYSNPVIQYLLDGHVLATQRTINPLQCHNERCFDGSQTLLTRYRASSTGHRFGQDGLVYHRPFSRS